MQRKRNIPIALVTASAALLGTFAVAEPIKPTSSGEYDALPAGSPGELARLFHSALDLPNVRQWRAEGLRQLLVVVTVRYKHRLIDRAPPASEEQMQRYVEQLANSPLAQESSTVVRQTCAQYGFTEGACVAHAGYVRRALVLEEMLARGDLSLEQLETELLGGEPRPKLSAWSAE